MTGCYTENTLRYNADLCTGCAMCATVCPHGVFAVDGGKAHVLEAESCMECGACQLNCPEQAIQVESGVGCAAAMMAAALRGKEEVCCGGGCG
jgi:NAD-dependent dihydropyrimidine dehydrogenase PreA subunit